MKLATQLIESISSGTFDTKAYHDECRQRAMNLIEQKSQGKILARLQNREAGNGVVDLMPRLNDSVAQTIQRKGARSRAILAQVPHEVTKKAKAGRR